MEATSDSDEDIPLALLMRNDVINGALEAEETTCLATADYDSEDDVPLVAFQGTNGNMPNLTTMELLSDDQESSEDDTSNMSFEEYYDSDRDPEFNPGRCEIKSCKHEVWAACPECEILLCFDHFNQDIPSCSHHNAAKSRKRKRRGKPPRNVPITDMEVASNNNVPPEVIIIDSVMENMGRSSLDMTLNQPEEFIVEGNEREVVREEKRRSNKQKVAKLNRDSGKEYISVKTNKKLPAKEMKDRCKGKCGKQCKTITDGQRQDTFPSYFDLADLRLQREFLVRHIQCSKTNKTSKPQESTSRRQITKRYFLSVNFKLVPVCKIFFLNTLGISEQVTRTALDKLTPSGTITKENRRGRKSETVVARDSRNREPINAHIDKFPRVESHFCRSSTSKEYLYPELTHQKMYNMFLTEIDNEQDHPSFSLYTNIFNEKNLAFHRPKKDQCSLCMNFLKGDEHVRETLESQYRRHESEKNKVRELKTQQVIYLPVSKESALFYKRRLSNYNLTFYNIADRHCHCYVWDEATSKRGSSEISTSVYSALKLYDEKGVKKAFLFCDGCGGQNKNSITPAMLLYMVTNSKNIQEVSVRFFETNHGQNEGDSAHSAISQAIKSAGDLFLPSQLTTVFSLARPQQPFIVHRFEFDDFYDFKSLSKKLRILDAQRHSGSEDMFNWNS